MSEFSKRAVMGDDSLLEEHGDPVQYLPPRDGKPIDVAFALVSEETTEEVQDAIAGSQIRYVVFIKLCVTEGHPKYSGISNPQNVGKFVAGGVLYDVYSLSRNAQTGWAEFEVRRYGRPRGLSRTGHEGGAR